MGWPVARSPGGHDIGDRPALQTGHPVGQHARGHTPVAVNASAINPNVVDARWSEANATNRQREKTSTAQNRNNPGAACAQSMTRYCPGVCGDALCATTLSRGRPGAGSCGPSRRSRRRGRSAASVWPTSGLMGCAAHVGGSSIRPEVLVGSNDVHAVLRRLQWNSVVVVMNGWRLHRHRRGPQLPINTTNTGWGLSSGQKWGPPPGHQCGLFHGHGQPRPAAERCGLRRASASASSPSSSSGSKDTTGW
jgi:hypothetical protein